MLATFRNAIFILALFSAYLSAQENYQIKWKDVIGETHTIEGKVLSVDGPITTVELPNGQQRMLVTDEIVEQKPVADKGEKEVEIDLINGRSIRGEIVHQDKQYLKVKVPNGLVTLNSLDVIKIRPIRTTPEFLPEEDDFGALGIAASSAEALLESLEPPTKNCPSIQVEVPLTEAGEAICQGTNEAILAILLGLPIPTEGKNLISAGGTSAQELDQIFNQKSYEWKGFVEKVMSLAIRNTKGYTLKNPDLLANFLKKMKVEKSIEAALIENILTPASCAEPELLEVQMDRLEHELSRAESSIAGFGGKLCLPLQEVEGTLIPESGHMAAAGCGGNDLSKALSSQASDSWLTGVWSRVMDRDCTGSTGDFRYKMCKGFSCKGKKTTAPADMSWSEFMGPLGVSNFQLQELSAAECRGEVAEIREKTAQKIYEQSSAAIKAFSGAISCLTTLPDPKFTHKAIYAASATMQGLGCVDLVTSDLWEAVDAFEAAYGGGEEEKNKLQEIKSSIEVLQDSLSEFNKNSDLLPISDVADTAYKNWVLIPGLNEKIIEGKTALEQAQQAARRGRDLNALAKLDELKALERARETKLLYETERAARASAANQSLTPAQRIKMAKQGVGPNGRSFRAITDHLDAGEQYKEAVKQAKKAQETAEKLSKNMAQSRGNVTTTRKLLSEATESLDDINSGVRSQLGGPALVLGVLVAANEYFKSNFATPFFKEGIQQSLEAKDSAKIHRQIQERQRQVEEEKLLNIREAIQALKKMRKKAPAYCQANFKNPISALDLSGFGGNCQISEKIQSALTADYEKIFR